MKGEELHRERPGGDSRESQAFLPLKGRIAWLEGELGLKEVQRSAPWWPVDSHNGTRLSAWWVGLTPESPRQTVPKCGLYEPLAFAR